VSDTRCLLDASAVLAWLFRERGEQVVDRLLEHAALSTVNLAEVLYRAGEEGMRTANIQRDLEGLGLQMVSFTDQDARLVQEVRGADRRARARISFAACCCLATGLRMNLPVVGGDQVWETLRLGVEVHPLH
jgi:ribonuclease VapC